MMTEREFVDLVNQLLRELRGWIDVPDFVTFHDDYDYGRERAGFEFLCRTLVEESVPVTARIRELLGQILRDLDHHTGPESTARYDYIRHPDRTLAALNVLDP